MLVTVAFDERLGRRQIDQRPDRLAGPFHGPHLEPLGDRKQEHDACAFGPLAEHERTRDGDDHQHVDVQRARTDCGDCPPGGMDAAEDCGSHEPGCGQAGMSERRHQEAEGQGAARRHDQTPTCVEAGGRGDGLFMLEPHAHAGVADDVDHGRGRQLGGVVFDVKALTVEIC